jgi:hypothetical protein
MPEGTLRLPIRPASPSKSKKQKRSGRRRRPITFMVIVGLVALTGVGAWAWWNGSVGSVPVREHCTATAAGSAAEVDPDQAGNAAIIASVASKRGLPARAASIGIATAIQESKLRNINYGDRDSVGLFQQRPSMGWGTRKQIADPVYATNAFYDVLSKVNGYETMPITKVAQKVQRSGFPEAYADHEPEAKIIASALSGYSPAGFTCVLRPSTSTAQAVGSGGLTARARALRAAADRETGHTSASVNSKTTLHFAVGNSAGDRSAWALAHWAVARAEGLDVVKVQVAGQVWDRDHSTDGWTKAKAASALPNGQVVIRVA